MKSSGGSCIVCKAAVVDSKSFGPEGQLCGPHLASYKKREVDRANQKAERSRRELREFIQARAEVAIPKRYSVMEALTGDESKEDMARALMSLNARMRTQNNAAVLEATMQAVRTALTQRGMFIVFAGPTGTGKSHMLAFALRMLANSIPLEPIYMNPLTRRGGDGLFSEDWTHEGSDPFVLWESSKKLFEAGKRGDDIRPYEDVAVLALDDIGNEPRQVNCTPVHDIVWERYDQRRLTIGSTGFVNSRADPEDVDAFFAPLAERYDFAFVRRLANVPECVRVIPMLPPT